MTEPTARDEAGFTLLEAIAGVAAMAAIVSALSLIAGQWMPTWRHGFEDLQSAERLGMGLDRITADVSAAEYITLDASAQGPVFEGLPASATFVRSAIGPNSAPSLEFVRIADTPDAHGGAVVRSSAPFAPGDSHPVFGHGVALTRSPFRISFAYTGPDRHWLDTWTQNPHLPDAVRVTVRDAKTGLVLAASTATLMKVTAAPPTPEAAGAAGAASPPTTPAAATPQGATQ